MGLQWPEVAPTRRSTPHPRLRHPSSVCGGAAAYTAAVRRAERKHAVGTASLSSQHTNTQCALNEAHEYTMHFSDTAYTAADGCAEGELDPPSLLQNFRKK
jgi:hypothetical protein